MDNSYSVEEIVARSRKNREPPPPAQVTDAGTFLRSYEPLSYTIDGVLPSGYLYGLTGPRGHGKTACATSATIACIKGDEKIIGCPVRQGRVAYVTKENPTDFKMKLAVNCYINNRSYDDVAPLIAIIQGDDSPESIKEGLRLDAEQHGDFVLVVYDTFQAGFDGSDFNNNAEVLKFLRRLRPFTALPGQPTVLVLMHPTKNAGEDELFPYGGGSIMNELDGNFSIWCSGLFKFSQNKVRGPEFEPMIYRIEKLSCPDILDVKGRQILLPVMRASSAEAAEASAKNDDDTSLALLKTMLDVPNGTQKVWAIAIGKSQSTLYRFLQKLKKEGLVTENLGKWRPTRKGTKIAE